VYPLCSYFCVCIYPFRVLITLKRTLKYSSLSFHCSQGLSNKGRRKDSWIHIQQQQVQNKRRFNSRNSHNTLLCEWRIQNQAGCDQILHLQPPRSDFWWRLQAIHVLPPPSWPLLLWPSGIYHLSFHLQHGASFQQFWRELDRDLQWHQRWHSQFKNQVTEDEKGCFGHHLSKPRFGFEVGKCLPWARTGKVVWFNSKTVAKC